MLDPLSIRFFKQATMASDYRETPIDVSCHCPICGDSKNKNIKRLHLYEKGGVIQVNCFNGGCAVENKTVYSFLRDFYPDLLPQYKKETFTNKIDYLKSTQSLGDLVTHKEINICHGSKPQVEVTNDPMLLNLYPFMDELTPESITYLQKRKIQIGNWFIANTDIKIGETTYPIKDYLIIPLLYNNLWYGFYSRNLLEKQFYTYVSTNGYKIWNWFDINKEKPCYIFEAIFDALSTGLDNIVACLGAKIPDERLKELQIPVFCLDNDTTGIQNSIKYAEQGHRVYVQPREYPEKDFNELKLNHPDLDIVQLVKDNTYAGISAITRLKQKL